MKTALITGITGQDGAYLSEFLLEKGYIVHGIKRRNSNIKSERIDHLTLNENLSDRFHLHYGDVTDSSNIIRIIKQTQPDEIYNLAAQSHVQISFETAEYSANTDALGALRILEAIRILGLDKKTKFYQASTSEMYGKTNECPQNEQTPFYPRSPYGIAKLYAYWTAVNYRESYNIFAVNGILFNHESPLRGENFVTRKITIGTAKIALNKRDSIKLGNLDSMRDWGHAKDYVDGMWRMMQHEKAEDFVLATGKSASIRDFIRMCFAYLGIELEFRGEGVNEKGFVIKCNNPMYQIETNKEVISIESKYFRPAEVDVLVGDATKAKNILGWEPTYDLQMLVNEMMEEEMKKEKN